MRSRRACHARWVLTRRDLLRGAALAPVLAACSRATTDPVMPVVFLAHGSPLLLDDSAWVSELATWAAALPRPTAVLIVSAHWQADPITVGATTPVPLVHDFSGFPQRYSRVRYPAPGTPALADRVTTLLAPAEVWDDKTRGLDHGAYVPLVAMYPHADVPVLQLSLPSLDPKRLFEIGRALAPLRREGVLIVGSGFLTHNVRRASYDLFATPETWASDFDAWCADVLARRDVDALLDYRARAPGVELALPSHEHFAPVLVSLGASIDRSERASFPITGWMAGNFTKRSLQLG